MTDDDSLKKGVYFIDNRIMFLILMVCWRIDSCPPCLWILACRTPSCLIFSRNI